MSESNKLYYIDVYDRTLLTYRDAINALERYSNNNDTDNYIKTLEIVSIRRDSLYYYGKLAGIPKQTIDNDIKMSIGGIHIRDSLLDEIREYYNPTYNYYDRKRKMNKIKPKRKIIKKRCRCK